MQAEELQKRLYNAVLLAPLTKVGNLPFRRLCKEFGADVTYSEMVYARHLVKRQGRERALLRKHASEDCFGVQLAALQTEEAVQAAKLARDAGADFIDINCGCPIDDTTRRGLGAALLRRPKTLLRLVEALATNLDCAVTVKVRLGWSESSMNVLELAPDLERAGAAAITVHGRTKEQRYARSADWDLIGRVRESVKIPVIGNGDILTPYEASARRTRSGVNTVMLARGALIKPWLFRELKEDRVIPMTSADRVSVYYRLSRHELDHFGDDEFGRKRALQFLTYQLDFLHRYRYLPAEEWEEQSSTHPLLQTRMLEVGENAMERLLCISETRIHESIAAALLSAATESEALERLQVLAETVEATPMASQMEDVANG